jgi:NADPH-dependent 2,4-dienoyl-CoA reductase/sulfur reductase-like enzyme
VEIHAGHGYLINQFLSRSTNKRKDAYGGTFENRIRFLMEIINSIRNLVGPEYPVWCRIDGCEFSVANGITLQESQQLAGIIEEFGIDAINVSGYASSTGFHFTEAPLVNTPGYLVPLAKGIKEKVNIPVITARRIDLASAENILGRGDADFIAMGRPLLADPELPNKIANGASGDIRKCIYCYTCVHQIFVRNNICCAVNPSVGKESEPVPPPPQKVKKVLVEGGGPAGLEVDCTAASRGHKVILYEKERSLGGSLRFASIVRQENEDLVNYLIHLLKSLNVEVKTGEAITPESVELIKPDVLVLATGAVRKNPPLPGIDGKNVINGDDLREMLSGNAHGKISSKLTAAQKVVLYPGAPLLKSIPGPRFIRQFTKRWMPVGKKVAILGGGMVGCELALFMAERGRKVTILENTDQIAPEMSLPLKWIALEKMKHYKVDIMTEVKYEAVISWGVKLVTKNGINQTIPADTIIVAMGAEPDNDVLAAFQGKAPEVYMAGDCQALSYIKDSIAGGVTTALNI